MRPGSSSPTTQTADGWRGAALADLVDVLRAMPDPMAGTQIDLLEQALAAYSGARHAVAASCGTAALHLALAAHGIGPGSEVLVPALSVVMSVAPILHAGGRPVFVDCRPDSHELDLDDLKDKITPASAAIMAVHLWGRMDDVPALNEVAAAHRLPLIEDACQAQGATRQGRLAGTGGLAGCFSLKDGKVLSCGEGGYLLTDDTHLAERARGLRSHWQVAAAVNTPPRIGYNYRLAEPLAAIARAGLAQFPALLNRRRQQAALLGQLLAGTPGLAVMHPEAGWNGYTPLATVQLPDPRSFCQRLAACGVPNSIGTFGLVAADQRPVLAASLPAPCPNAAQLIDETLAVVVTDRDTDEDLARYADTITREATRWPARC